MSAELQSGRRKKIPSANGGVIVLGLSFAMLTSGASALSWPNILSPADIRRAHTFYASSYSTPPADKGPVTIGREKNIGSLSINQKFSGAGSSSSGIVMLTRSRKRQPEPARLAAATAPNDSLEVRFWNAIKNSDVASDFRTYLDAYPDGQFAAQARSRLQQIDGKGDGAPTNSNTLSIKPMTQPGNAPASNVVRDCQKCPQLVLIPAGAFIMGSTEMFPFEGPVHQVVIRKPFYIGQREVTFEEWDACVADGGCDYSPSHRGVDSGSLPVTNLDWEDTQRYLDWLTKKTGKTYRLPSESEWEYAARAGSTTTYSWGRTMEKNRANCSGCNDEPSDNTIATGSYPANDFGLYDMAGNAAEWVEDCWNDSYKSAPTDGSAWIKPRCQERVLRGGSFNNDPRYLRSASRFKYDFDVRYYTNGFRVVREK
jgi:formylglycine-generating enzyme required for sulfatase activity